MTGRDRVRLALQQGKLEHPPKGEILIDTTLVQTAGFEELIEAVADLQTDLVVLPLGTDGKRATNWREWGQQAVFIFGWLPGPLTAITEWLGWHIFSRLIIKQPLEAAKLVKKFSGAAVQKAIAAMDQGCEGLIVLDDLAGDGGLLVNPQWLQDTYFPLMGQALARLNCKTVPVLFHSDGNIIDLIPLLKTAGFWGIQGLQPGLGIGPATFPEQERDWVYWGNFDFEGRRRLKTIAEVEDDVIQLLTQWRDFPGYIFGSSGGLYKGLAWPQIKAAYTAAGNWRR